MTEKKSQEPADDDLEMGEAQADDVTGGYIFPTQIVKAPTVTDSKGTKPVLPGTNIINVNTPPPTTTSTSPTIKLDPIGGGGASS